MSSPSNQALLETVTRAAREAGLHALRKAHLANECHVLLPHADGATTLLCSVPGIDKTHLPFYNQGIPDD